MKLFRKPTYNELVGIIVFLAAVGSVALFMLYAVTNELKEHRALCPLTEAME